MWLRAVLCHQENTLDHNTWKQLTFGNSPYLSWNPSVNLLSLGLVRSLAHHPSLPVGLLVFNHSSASQWPSLCCTNASMSWAVYKHNRKPLCLRCARTVLMRTTRTRCRSPLPTIPIDLLLPLIFNQTPCKGGKVHLQPRFLLPDNQWLLSASFRWIGKERDNNSHCSSTRRNFIFH